MAGSTEGLGRLIAEEVLFNGERQLLRNRDETGQQPHDSPAAAQPAPEPISHNDKAVASVLLTMLDEQLDGLANRDDVLGRSTAFSPRPGEAVYEKNRAAAQYAEADAAYRPDLPRQQTEVPPNLNAQQVLLAANSPELRMAMQSAFVSAAVLAQSGRAISDPSGQRRYPTRTGLGSWMPMRAGAGVVAVVALVILVATYFAH